MKLTHLTDVELASGFDDVIAGEQEIVVLHLEFLAEMERRKLYFQYDSLWAYLVHEKKIDGGTANRRIRAAKLMNRFPFVKEKLDSGKLNLSLLDLAQGCANREQLSEDEFLEIIESISGMSTRQAEREIVTRYPRSIDIPHDKIQPLDAELSEVRFVADNELLDLLDDVRGLVAHSHPRASIAELIKVMATEFRERHHPKEKAKRAQARQEKESEKNDKSQPAPAVLSGSNRTPSQELVHALVLRDGYKCSYVDPVTNERCCSTYALQIDHIRSWATGGETVLENLRYLCSGHHRRVSFLEFGDATDFAKRRLE